jgi:hypothetical protein
MRRSLLAAGLALALAGGACGEQDDPERIGATYDDLRAAVAERDAGAVCDLLGPRARRQVRGIGHLLQFDCAPAVEPLLQTLTADGGSPAIAREGEVVDVEMRIGAVVEIAVDGERLRVPFVVEDGEWKLDSFYGRSPRPGDIP